MDGDKWYREEMAAINFTKEPFSELRETEAVYTRAMKYLVADGGKQGKVGVSVCWRRLNRLHQACFQTVGAIRAYFLSFQAHSEAEDGVVVSGTESDMESEYQPLSRVERLLAAHPWLIKSQASRLLSIKYVLMGQSSPSTIQITSN